jgi:hypothetical protein
MRDLITMIAAVLILCLIFAPQTTGKDLRSIADRFMAGWSAK